MTIIVGSNGSDTVTGTNSSDIIITGNGDDTINGGSGNDIILAGNGNDTVDGGSGTDIIDGGNGNDTIDGGSGNDIIDGGNGNDILNGGSGDDIILGGNGNDMFIHNVTENIDINNCTTDFYDGERGIDTLKLIVTASQLADLQAAINAFATWNKNVIFDFKLYVPYADLKIIHIEKLIVEVVGSANQAPTNILLSAAAVDENAAGAIIGALSVVDPNAGDTHTYAVSDARFEVVAGQLKLKAGISLDHEAEPSVNLSVTATDNGGLSVIKFFTLTVNNVNEAPILSADTLTPALDENMAGAILANLSVADPDSGDTHTYVVSDARFEVVAGQLKLKAGISLDHEAEPTVNLSVTVTDAGGLSDTQNFVITVNNLNDNAPVLVVTPVVAAVDENAANIVMATLSATDADGNALTYSLSGADAAKFAIQGNNLVLISPVDYEAQQNLNVILTVSDGLPANNQSQALSFAVNNLNDNAPVLSVTPLVVAVDENAANIVMATFSATDADGNALTYSLSGADAAKFAIQGNNLVLIAPVDYEAQQNLNVILTVSDGLPANNQSQALSFAVNNLNDNAPVLVVTPVVAAVDENAANIVMATLSATDADVNALTYSLSGADAAKFAIQGNNLVLISPVDYEAQQNLNVILTVSDGLPANNQSQALSFAVNNVNEAPTNILLSAASLNENAAGAIIGALSVVDPDGGDSHTYVVSDARFEVVAGQLKLKAGMSLDHEAEPSVNLSVTSTDAGGLSVTKAFVVTVNNVNEAPVFNAANQIPAQQVNEGAILNIPLPAGSFTDVDQGDTLTYSALYNGATLPSWLSIDPLTGALSGTAPLVTANQVNTITIIATDSGGLQASQSFNLTVNDVAPQPPVALNDYNVMFALLDSTQTLLPFINEDTSPFFNFVTKPLLNDMPMGVILVDYSIVFKEFTPEASGHFIDASGSTAIEAGLIIQYAFQGLPSLQYNGGYDYLSAGQVLDVPVYTYYFNDLNTGLSSNTATFYVTIMGENDAPVFNAANAIPDAQINEGAALNIALPAGVFTDVDQNDQLTYSALYNGGALPSWLSIDPLTGALSGTAPAVTANQVNTITVIATDPSGAQVSDTFNLTINDVPPQPPVAVDDLNVMFRYASNSSLAIPFVDENDISYDNDRQFVTQPLLNDIYIAANSPIIDLPSIQFTAQAAGHFTQAILPRFLTDVTLSLNYFLNGYYVVQYIGGYEYLSEGQTLDVPVYTYRIADPVTGFFSNTGTFHVTVVGANDNPSDINLSGTTKLNSPGAIIGTLSSIDLDTNDTHTYSVSDARFEIVSGNVLKLIAGVSLSASSFSMNITSTDSYGASVTKSFTFPAVNNGAITEGNITTINGSANHDFLVGTSGQDIIDGGGGGDTIIGGAGIDTIYAHAGDTVYADARGGLASANTTTIANTIHAGEGNNTLYGGFIGQGVDAFVLDLNQLSFGSVTKLMNFEDSRSQSSSIPGTIGDILKFANVFDADQNSVINIQDLETISKYYDAGPNGLTNSELRIFQDTNGDHIYGNAGDLVAATIVFPPDYYPTGNLTDPISQVANVQIV